MTAAAAPGLTFTVEPRPVEPSPLRSDVAAFLGSFRRGPVGTLERVEGWRGFARTFGGVERTAPASYSVFGYFENGGDIAYVSRMSGDNATKANQRWVVGALKAGKWTPSSPAGGGFTAQEYKFVATSPGAWANGTRVSIEYRLRGRGGKPEVELGVEAPGEPLECHTGLCPKALVKQVTEASALVALEETATVPDSAAPGPGDRDGPSRLSWQFELANGADDVPGRRHYAAGVSLLGEDAKLIEAQEIALVVLPDLHDHITECAELDSLIEQLATQAAQNQDRLVVLDVPSDRESAEDVLEWIDRRVSKLAPRQRRTVAVYHPRVDIRDPSSGANPPLRRVPASGHCAGLISRLDRERGAHHTPANAVLRDAVDTAAAYSDSERAALNDAGVNLIRCLPGRGLAVWGGRTLDRELSGRFIAHRRLIHRLVRAIRRVAEPLVFDNNGPELWLTFVRAITTVLLEAYRAGALKGARPDEAFRVRCDESTNTPADRDNGRVVCEIDVAPAVPMEFIHLRIAVADTGQLEVFES